MHQNSLTAYREKVIPNIKQKHKRVIETLAELGEACQLEVADKMGVQVNHVSGRFTELVGSKEYGRPILEIIGSKLNRYNNPCSIYRIKLPQPQGEQGQLCFMNTKMTG